MGTVLTKCKSKRKVEVYENPPNNLMNARSKSIKLTHVSQREDLQNRTYLNEKNDSQDLTVRSSVPSESLALLNELKVKKKVSIFDSLQMQENEFNNKTPASASLSTNILSKKTVTPHKVKKYKLIKNIVNTENIVTTICSSTDIVTTKCPSTDDATTKNSSINIFKVNRESTEKDAKQYLIKVKSILSKEQYADFGSSMTCYKKNGDIRSLIDGFDKLFDKKSLIHMDLIQGFSFFVRKDNDKKLFSAAIDRWIVTWCVICKNEALKPHFPPCNHMGCYPCWFQIKRNGMKCPECGLSFKWRQLNKSYFDGIAGLNGYDFSRLL